MHLQDVYVSVLEAENINFSFDFKRSPVPEEPSPPHYSDSDDSVEDNYDHIVPASLPATRSAMSAKRVPSFSPTPKPRSKTPLKRSMSYDQLATVEGEGEGEGERTNGRRAIPVSNFTQVR